MRFARSSGVLLHPTCLPGPWGVGDLGPAAYRYLEWLHGAGVGWWQVLPLNPVGPGWSPYAGLSTFAGNTMLVSPELLAQEGLLTDEDLAAAPEFSPVRVGFERVAPHKQALLRRAFERFESSAGGALDGPLTEFRERAGPWLAESATFGALKRAHGGAPWPEWEEGLAFRRDRALPAWLARHERDVRFEEFCQFLFSRQWVQLRERARALGIQVLGDVPIYVAHDSAEVWANRELFRLDARGQPTVVAGVPPDYFSATGQLWGNPLYDWEAIEARRFEWWVARLRRALELVDVVRLDHFRGFAGYWEVPAGAKTAVEGRWVTGPGRKLFDALSAAIGELPMVAEDLGFITEDVTALRDALDLPGMAVLQFAFSPSPRSRFLPHSHHPNMVVYTGTHDNNTTAGWYRDDAKEEERAFARRYLGTDGREIHWDMIRAALSSVADLAVVPHQDVAGLGADCRMNTPATSEGNWRFRITESMLSDALRDRLGELVWLYGR
jgi:4-alpha-glucanotransferase